MRVSLRWLALALCALTLSACVALGGKSHLSGGPYQGVVRDKATGEPIANAMVLIKWNGSTNAFSGGGRSLCYYHEPARTGSDGGFAIKPWRVSTDTGGRDPTWLPYIEHSHIEPLIFAPGYRQHFSTWGDPMKLELERFPLDQVNEEIGFLLVLRYKTVCLGHDNRVDLPMRLSIYRRAIALAESNPTKLNDSIRRVVDGFRDELKENAP